MGDAASFRGPIEVKAKGKSSALELFAVVEVGAPYNVAVPAEQVGHDAGVSCSGSVTLQRVVGKEVRDESIAGRATLIGREIIEVLVAEPIEVYDDFRISVALREPEELVMDDLYAKATTVEVRPDGRTCRLRLTSVPDEERRRLESVLDRHRA